MYVNHSWQVGPLKCDQRIMDGNAHLHEKSHIDQTGNIVWLCRYLDGRVEGRTGETPYSIRPGDLTIRDTARAFEGVQTPAVYQIVYFPHDLVGFDPGRDRPFTSIEGDSSIGRMLHRELDILFQHLMSGRSEIKHEGLARLASCLKWAVSGNSAKPDVRLAARAAMGDLIREHIEANLKSPSLCTSSLLKTFGLSRATLYRIFEADEGVRKYINDRRLFRAVLDISNQKTKRGAISQAAEEWGFSSNANFNRAVKRQFGVAPASLFGMDHEASAIDLAARQSSRALSISQLHWQRNGALLA